jgi:hypothetical protein
MSGGKRLLVWLAVAAIATMAFQVNSYGIRDSFAAAYRISRDLVVGRCHSPIAYEIGSIDPRFGTSEASLLAAVAEAEALWEAAAGRELFTHVAAGDGTLTIELVYDDRQANTTAAERYDEDVTRHNARAAAYDAKVAAFNERVEEWNRDPGSRREREALERDGEALEREAAELTLAGEALNRRAAELNEWNSANEAFQSAVYDGSGSITVYDYANARELKVQLAHELGHALGMDHVDDERAVMYYLLDSENPKPLALADADVAALRTACDLE